MFFRVALGVFFIFLGFSEKQKSQTIAPSQSRESTSRVKINVSLATSSLPPVFINTTKSRKRYVYDIF